jgi:hypothetical protein
MAATVTVSPSPIPSVSLRLDGAMISMTRFYTMYQQGNKTVYFHMNIFPRFCMANPFLMGC